MNRCLHLFFVLLILIFFPLYAFKLAYYFDLFFFLFVQMFSELRAHILASQVREVLCLKFHIALEPLVHFFLLGPSHNLLGSLVLLLWYKLG